jgi:hypothetical protein
MRTLLTLVLVAVVAAAAGCGGGSSTSLNTAPLTDEQKAKIKEQDRQVDDEENARNTKRPKKS